MKSQTWLPIFPGFYGTLFENLLQDYDQYGEEIALEDALEEERREDVARKAVLFVDQVMRDLEFPGYIGLEFERLWSPREYNFSNDEIQVTLEYDEETFALALNDVIHTNLEKFQRLIVGEFTNRPGFFSRYSNDLEDWYPVQLGGRFEDGFYLQFILDVLAEDNDEEAMYEYIRGYI